MNAKQRRHNERHNERRDRKLADEFLGILIQLKKDLTDKSLTLEEFISLVDEIIELRKNP